MLVLTLQIVTLVIVDLSKWRKIFWLCSSATYVFHPLPAKFPLPHTHKNTHFYHVEFGSNTLTASQAKRNILVFSFYESLLTYSVAFIHFYFFLRHIMSSSFGTTHQFHHYLSVSSVIWC